MTDFVKWDKVAREAVAQVVAEAEEEIKENDAELGLDRAPLSAAEAEDRKAHEELKEVRKAWNQREAAEQAAKLVVRRQNEDFELTDKDLTPNQRVISLYDCKSAKIRLTASLSAQEAKQVIKVFIEDCQDLDVLVECSLTTSFIEISRCKHVRMILSEKIHTIQSDLNEDLSVTWHSAELFDSTQPKIYHAGCTRLTVNAGAERTITTTDDSTNQEQQFITHQIQSKLITEKLVVSGDSGRLLGATQRELDIEQSQAERAAKRQTQVTLVQAERTKGNEAFAKHEYTQAILHYTLALDAATKDQIEKLDRAIILSNRAAAWLKLGHPEKALDDATEAADLSPNYAKAHFRKGLALHALQRYKEALPALGTAQKIEPKNKQVAEAIRFAEMRLARGNNLKNPYAD